jgi:hypothetical protein
MPACDDLIGCLLKQLRLVPSGSRLKIKSPEGFSPRWKFSTCNQFGPLRLAQTSLDRRDQAFSIDIVSAMTKAQPLGKAPTTGPSSWL